MPKRIIKDEATNKVVITVSNWARVIDVNGNRAFIGKAIDYDRTKEIGVKEAYKYYVSSFANDWNASNPITFETISLRGLAKKIANHPYKLVPVKR